MLRLTKARKVYSFLFKVLLFLAAVISIYNKIWMNLVLVCITLVLIYLPKFLSGKIYDSFPSKIEIIVLMLIYLSIFFEKTKLFNASFLLVRILLHMLISVIIGLIGFSIIYLLNKEKQVLINLNPLVISIFAFCFSITIGALWQIFRYCMNYIYQINVQHYNVSDAMGFLAVHSVGAGIVCLLGYLYLKSSEDKYFIKKVFKKVVKKNPELFNTGNYAEKKVLNMIKQGENNKIEFKSTLRTNLYTSKADKEIEYAALKTVVAFLNTQGGTLLVGVSDNGDILGLEKDNFKNHDRLNLHFVNILKKHIGHEFIPHISYEIIEIKGKDILKVDCYKSKRPTFLKVDNTEDFYIRTGPASMKLEGSKLIEYISRRFK